MRMEEVRRVGIMFDRPKDGGEAWPRLRDMPYPEAPYWADGLADDEGGDWYVVAVDAYRQYYPCDLDWEAMDRTNYDVVADVFGGRGEIPALDDNRDRMGNLSAERVAENLADGVATVERLLIVRPDMVDELEELESLRSQLADYPLLNEDAYSALEWEAWCDYVSDGLKFDTMRELDELDEATAETLEDQWDAIASWAQSRLHYKDGWHGDHSPPFHDCVAETIVGALQRTFLACMR